MMLVRRASALLSLSLSFSFLACGGSKEPATAPAQAESKPASADGDAPASDAKSSGETAAQSSGMPKECARKTGACVPPKAFVEKLCQGSYPSMALYLFGNKSPWSRGYLKGRTKAWNASG